jgi:hypothetical protein
MFTTLLWLSIFTIGLTVPSQVYRDRLLNLGTPKGPGFAEAVWSFVMVGIAFTPTNLAFLCCVASLAGCLGRMATTKRHARHERSAVTVSTISESATPATTDRPAESESTATSEHSVTIADGDLISPLAPGVAAITWGFFIYLVAISGTLVISGEPFKNTSPEQYLRMAGSASLAAFVVGWKPEILTQLLEKMRSASMFAASAKV